MAKKGFVPFMKKDAKGKDSGCAPKGKGKPFKNGGMVKGKKGC